jgi:hypothetical protein
MNKNVKNIKKEGFPKQIISKTATAKSFDLPNETINEPQSIINGKSFKKK